ncbi:MAG: peptidase T [Chitinophagaceae bacterium]|nr:peptidase T [Chitinophagaceae bacterium]
MGDLYKYTAASRFLQYVQIDTQSDPESKRQPSTGRQLDLARVLVKELKELEIDDAQLDEYGYVYATIPSNTTKKVPVICFCAHMDTSFDCSGTNVKPIVHEKYDGQPIVLPDDPTQIITTEEHPYLLEKIGEDIITASGTTLLGADDKAGIAVIMDLANYLRENPEVRHGAIKILFTPDEEIGRGVDKVDMNKLGADFGYTLDGAERGSLEDETFSADSVHIEVHGVSAHPGYAKGKMASALKIVAEFIDSLPKDSYSPESTADREGFFHPVKLIGTVEHASVDLIVRDFHTHKLAQYENFMRDRLNETVSRYAGATATFTIHEQYRNMKEILDQHPQVSEYAAEAIGRAGMTVRRSSARGGTDGSRLSFMGLPCPNLFTGEMAYHGKHEYVSVQDLEKSVDMCVELVKIWEEKS